MTTQDRKGNAPVGDSDIEIERNKFLRLDYDKGLQLLIALQSHKLSYQRFFITIVAVVSTVSIALVNFASSQGRDGIDALGFSFSIQELIGVLLILSALVGYFITKNLVSIRISEVFFNNAIAFVREELVEECGLGEGYPNVRPVKALRRESSDYISIAVFSIINLVLLLCGSALLAPHLDGMAGFVVVGILVLVVVVVHILTIEKPLGDDISRTHG